MTEILNVVVNPFLHLDQEGVPVGAVPFDPDHAAGARRWVGAWVDADRTRVLKLKGERYAPIRGRQVNASPPQRTFFAYALEPQKVLDNAYYRAALRDGDLLPADEDAARVTGKPLQPPPEALAALAVAAVAAWSAETKRTPSIDLWPENLRALLPSTPGPVLSLPATRDASALPS